VTWFFFLKILNNPSHFETRSDFLGPVSKMLIFLRISSLKKLHMCKFLRDEILKKINIFLQYIVFFKFYFFHLLKLKNKMCNFLRNFLRNFWTEKKLDFKNFFWNFRFGFFLF